MAKKEKMTTTGIVIEAIAGIISAIIFLFVSSKFIKILLGNDTFVNWKLPVPLPFIDSFMVSAKYVPWIVLVIMFVLVKTIMNSYTNIKQYIENKKK